MDSELGQIFARPIGDFLLERTGLRTLFSSKYLRAIALDIRIHSELLNRHRSLVHFVETTLRTFHPDGNVAAQKQQAEQMEQQIDEFAKTLFELLNDAQLQQLLTYWQMDLGHAQIFYVSFSQLSPTNVQQQAWKSTRKLAAAHALLLAEQELSKIQIRDPSAYVAYCYAQQLQCLRQTERKLGAEFVVSQLESGQQQVLTQLLPCLHK